MNNAAQAVEDIKSLANKMRGILAFAEILEKIGSIENAEAEAKLRMSKAVEDEKKAVEGCQKVAARLSQLNDDVKYAEDKATQIIANADLKAKEIIGAATTRGADIIEAANRQRDKIVSEVKSALNGLGEVKAEIVSKKSELSDIIGQIEEARKMIFAFVKK